MKNRFLYAACAALIAIAFSGCADTGAPSSSGSIAPSGSSGGSIGSH
ncbi:MAG: hypothetical protein WCD79_17985 [Chthoniobacteraceae bacterium]